MSSLLALIETSMWILPFVADCKVWKHVQTDKQENVVNSVRSFYKLNDGQVLSTEGASLRYF